MRNLIVREMDPPPQMPVTVRVEGQVTGGLGLLGRGDCKVEGQLLTPRACQNSEAMLKISIDNSNCQKMVAHVQFKVLRSIIAYGFTTSGERKEYKDE